MSSLGPAAERDTTRDVMAQQNYTASYTQCNTQNFV
jgi:hypothetical protein